jgi:hypothetical protein
MRLLALLSLVTLSMLGRALAQDAVQDRCAEAYEQSQRARNAGHLLEAREKAVLCGQDACSPILRGDCVSWARELAASIPSVVFDVLHADGSAPRALEVRIDGQPLAPSELGRAVPLDPGEHAFEFRDGAARVEVTVAVVEGARHQSVRARFPAPELTPVGASPSRRRRAGQALIGVGGAGIAAFAAFAAAGYARERELEDQCAPSCARSKAEPIERLYHAADVSLGVGMAAVALGLWSFFGDPARRERASADTRQVLLSAAPGRAALSWSTAF